MDQPCGPRSHHSETSIEMGSTIGSEKHERGRPKNPCPSNRREIQSSRSMINQLSDSEVPKCEHLLTALQTTSMLLRDAEDRCEHLVQERQQLVHERDIARRSFKAARTIQLQDYRVQPVAHNRPLAIMFEQAIGAKHPELLIQFILECFDQRQPLSQWHGLRAIDRMGELEDLRNKHVWSAEPVEDDLRDVNGELTERHVWLRRSMLGRIFCDHLLSKDTKHHNELIEAILPNNDDGFEATAKQVLSVTLSAPSLLLGMEHVAGEIEHEFPSWMTIVSHLEDYVQGTKNVLQFRSEGDVVYGPTSPLSPPAKGKGNRVLRMKRSLLGDRLRH